MGRRRHFYWSFAQGSEINAQSRPVVSSKNENFGAEVCVRWRLFERGGPGAGLARSSAVIYGRAAGLASWRSGLVQARRLRHWGWTR